MEIPSREVADIRPVFFEAGGFSEAKYRKDGSGNQDAWFKDNKANCAGVFDGLGKSQNPALASNLGAQLLPVLLRDIPSEYDEATSVPQLIAAVNTLNTRVIELSGSDEKGPAATVCAFKVFHNLDGLLGVFAHAGDSRGEVYRDDQVVAQTVDHSFSKDNSPELNLRLQLEESAATHQDDLSALALNHFETDPRVNSCLGKESTLIEITRVPLLSGDVVALMSDGVTRNLTVGERLEKVQATPDNPQLIAEEIVEQAYFTSLDLIGFRSRQDDITAVVLKIT